MKTKPAFTRHQALILPADRDPSGEHRRVSPGPTDLVSAKANLETRYGVGTVVSLWGDWESEQIRAQR
jgi:hypothetical protein